MNQQGSAEPFLINCCSNREKVTGKENQKLPAQAGGLAQTETLLRFSISD